MTTTQTQPKGWKETTLGEVTKITRGASPRPIHEFISDEGMPWVKIADASASQDRFIIDTKESIKLEGVKNSVEVHPGDLIMSNSATPGIPKIMKIDACIHDGWLLFRELKIDKYFLFYLLLNALPRFIRSASGTVFNNLKTDIVKAIEVVVPESETEQRAVAAVLSSLDDKIELLREQNKTLEATAQAIFKEWFAVPSEALAKEGELPEGWRVGKIKDLINIFSGFAFSSSDFTPNGKYKLVTIKNVQDRYFVQEIKDRLGDLPSKMQSYCNLKTGDILLSLTGNVGRICLVVGEDYLLNQRVAKLEPINAKDYAFCYLLFLQESIFSILQSTASGTAQQNLSPVQTKEIEIIIPSRDVLNSFGDLVNPMIQKINFNNSQIQTLSVLRDTLLPKLMKGEIRVQHL